MRGSKRALPGVAAVMLVLWTVSAPTPAAAKRVALVVGNSDYRYTTGLRNPRNDANDIAAALQRLGFSVISGMDLGIDSVSPGGAETFATSTPAPRCRLRFNGEDAEWSGRCVGGLAFGRGRAAGPGWSYTGQASRGRPSGRGSIELADGTRMQGNFINGELNGRGTFFLPDGSRMVGNIRNGELHGRGTVFRPDGTRMEGNFIGNELVGWVEFFFPDGTHIEGELRGGELSGQIFISMPDGRSCAPYVFGGDLKEALLSCLMK